MSKKVLFLDRDGTLNVEPEDQQVDRLEKVSLVSGVIPALLAFRDAGYRFVMVTNQDGLGTPSFPKEDFESCQTFIVNLFASQGILFDEILVCPHLDDDGCDCRKPKTGLLTSYLARTTIDLASSAVIGDRQTDMQLAKRIGISGFLLDPAGAFDTTWEGIRSALLSKERYAKITRETRETKIETIVNLDDPVPVSIRTGIGFYDHMLEQVATHGGFSLRLHCNGDLEVDEHHTVEDTAICLGSALKEALGDKRGITRYGFLLPMDEAEAKISIDLSGRAAFRFDGTFTRENIGALSCEMIPHFFQSLAESLEAAIHIEIHGNNNHHMAEACFKSLGRALRQAIRQEGEEIPSSKGVLG